MDQIPRISEAVYVGMCRLLGTPTIVSIRRDLLDITETIKASVIRKTRETTLIYSGSYREGFREAASDIDYMYWPADHFVIWDLNHADNYNSERCTLILMELSEERPGFAMLELLTPTNKAYVIQSCVRMNERLYIASSIYRENTLFLVRPDTFQHGPCARAMGLIVEFDYAHCFQCELWPSIATSFILRCQSYAWPPNHVFREIINSGFHFVPIGLKGSPQEDCEWRISFSLAEQKLVYCMNHTQFMCYGLLKLFLKEVLTVEDTNGEPLLCSYFMKTVLFWVIQNKTLIDWNPASLLSGFWMCFKFLLSCVYNAYLPNFFIPENNIFISKVFGRSRQLLCERLFDIYSLGIACLIHCHSISDCLSRAFCNRQYEISTVTSDLISDGSIDFELFYEIYIQGKTGMFYCDVISSLMSLHTAIRYLYAQTLNPKKYVFVRKLISSILRYNVYQFYNTSSKFHNKRRLRIMYVCMNLLKVSVKMGCLSDRIYLVLFLHALGKYKDAIRNLMTIKTIITQPYVMNVMYRSTAENLQRFSDEVGGEVPSEKMRRAVIMDIDLVDVIEIIKELELETRVTIKPNILVPPYVMTLMLLVLCYRGNLHKQQEALRELFMSLHYNNGQCILEHCGDISWQILGICQQICGDHQGALLSYQISLKQNPFHNIQKATYYRIQDGQYRILCSLGRE